MAKKKTNVLLSRKSEFSDRIQLFSTGEMAKKKTNVLLSRKSEVEQEISDRIQLFSTDSGVQVKMEKNTDVLFSTESGLQVKMENNADDLFSRKNKVEQEISDHFQLFSTESGVQVKMETNADVLLSMKNEIEQEISDHIKLFSTDSNDDLCDMIIRCEDGQVSAHIQIFALYSKLLRNILHQEEKDLVLYALDFKCSNVRQLLGLLYTGSVELIDDDIKKLSELCDLLGVSKNFKKRKRLFNQEKNLSSRKAEAKSRKKRIFTANRDISELTCDICFKVFSKMYKLKNHQLIHQNSFPFICSDCGKGFKNKYKLNAHEKDHGKRRMQQIHNKTKEIVKEQKNYPCKDCGLIFAKAMERKQHVEDNHKVVVNHSCCHCSSKFTTKRKLIAHMRVVHNDVEGNLRHVCTICDKRFPRPSHLEEHMARHNPVGQHPCMYCPKRCATKSDLDRHLASHKGENKYTCELCFKSFVHRSTYTVHVRRHLGQKPYVCRPCNKNFSQYKSLKTHQKKHERRNDRTLLVAPRKGSRGLHSYIDIIPEQPEIDNSIIVAKPKEMATPNQVYLPGPQYNKSTGFKANQQSASAPLKQQFITDYAEISRIGYQYSDGDTDGFAAIVEMESLFDATNALNGTNQSILNDHNIT